MVEGTVSGRVVGEVEEWWEGGEGTDWGGIVEDAGGVDGIASSWRLSGGCEFATVMTRLGYILLLSAYWLTTVVQCCINPAPCGTR